MYAVDTLAVMSTRLLKQTPHKRVFDYFLNDK